MDLWGPEHNLDYWTAAAVHAVPIAERRAVGLLRSLCDEQRSSLYCVTGRLSAVGNVTGTVYLIRRRGGVLELDDGRPVASWCISIGPHALIPPSDNVLAIKNLIEGEELAFRRTGNRGPYFHLGNGLVRHSGVVDPLETSIMPDRWDTDPLLQRTTGNAFLVDLEAQARALQQEVQRHQFQMEDCRDDCILPLRDARTEQKGGKGKDDDATFTFGSQELVVNAPVIRNNPDPLYEPIWGDGMLRRAIEREIAQEMRALDAQAVLDAERDLMGLQHELQREQDCYLRYDPIAQRWV